MVPHPCVHELLSTSLGWWKMACGMDRLGLGVPGELLPCMQLYVRKLVVWAHPFGFAFSPCSVSA